MHGLFHNVLKSFISDSFGEEQWVQGLLGACHGLDRGGAGVRCLIEQVGFFDLLHLLVRWCQAGGDNVFAKTAILRIVAVNDELAFLMMKETGAPVLFHPALMFSWKGWSILTTRCKLLQGRALYHHRMGFCELVGRSQARGAEA